MKALVTIQGSSPVLLGEGVEEVVKNKEGELCFPAEEVKQSIVTAGLRFKQNGSRRKNMSKTLHEEVTIKPKLLSFGTSRHTYHKRAAVVGKKTHEINLRPMVDDWQLEFEINTGDLSLSLVREILERAGQFIGLGNFRPDFGRYRIVSFQEK